MGESRRGERSRSSAFYLHPGASVPTARLDIPLGTVGKMIPPKSDKSQDNTRPTEMFYLIFFYSAFAAVTS